MSDVHRVRCPTVTQRVGGGGGILATARGRVGLRCRVTSQGGGTGLQLHLTIQDLVPELHPIYEQHACNRRHA